ncbi:MAG: hypothetical protein U5N53_12130 [Mycobacterium sp.]|nr:hypothetical protein [Mycobacterium sp.]
MHTDAQTDDTDGTQARLTLAVLDDTRSALRWWLPETARRRLATSARRTLRHHGGPGWATTGQASALAALHLLGLGALNPVLSPARRGRLHRLLWAELTCTPMDAPVVQVHDGGKQVAVACPYCPSTPSGTARRHWHGLPGGLSDLPTLRVAHCMSNRNFGGYRIVTGGDAVL